MNIQDTRTLQETRTALAPPAVIVAAKRFFAKRNAIYAAYPEREGEHWVSLRGQGGEEVIVAAQVSNAATLVTASSYMFDQQIARFLSTLPAAPELPAIPAGENPA